MSLKLFLRYQLVLLSPSYQLLRLNFFLIRGSNPRTKDRIVTSQVHFDRESKINLLLTSFSNPDSSTPIYSIGVRHQCIGLCVCVWVQQVRTKGCLVPLTHRPQPFLRLRPLTYFPPLADNEWNCKSLQGGEKTERRNKR